MKKIRFFVSAVATVLFASVLCGCGYTPPAPQEEKFQEHDGSFYSLAEAHERGYITAADLQSIAYYYNGTQDYPCPISEEAQRCILKTAYLDVLEEQEELASKIRAEEFWIAAYYGYYDGSYALVWECSYIDYPAVVVDEWREIGGVRFHQTSPGFIVIWK